jgi:hypothetical protein
MATLKDARTTNILVTLKTVQIYLLFVQFTDLKGLVFKTLKFSNHIQIIRVFILRIILNLIKFTLETILL